MSMELDPKLIKGNGIPVMGIRPMHIPTFSRTWNVQIPTMPTATSRKKSESLL